MCIRDSSNTYSLNPIGSGPYKLVSYTQGQQLILDRNEEYYGTKPVSYTHLFRI